LGPEVLRGIQLRLDGCDDGLGNFILDRKYVGDAAVVVLRPDMDACGDIVQLRRDPHPVSLLADTSLDYVADAQFDADLLDVHDVALVNKR